MKVSRSSARGVLGALALLPLAGAVLPRDASAQSCDPCQAGTIGGRLFADLNSNGVFDGPDTALGGVVHVLTPEGAPFASVPVSSMTGAWSVGPLTCGNWIVLAESAPGWTLTSPSLVSGQHFASLLTAGASLTQVDFGFQQLSCGAANFDDHFNSAWNETSGTVNASGVPDDDWTLTALWPIAPCTTSTGAMVTQSYPEMFAPSHPVTYNYSSTAWHAPLPNSEWVSVWPFTNTPNGEHYYQHCFCLAPGFQNPSFDFEIFADDEASVYLNGVHLYSTPANGFDPLLGPYPLPGDVVTDPTPHFRVGANCLTVRVENSQAVVTGFDIAGHLTAKNGQCCASPVPPAYIKGLKWFDSDADGNQDPGEPLIAGWPIVLYDHNHNVLPPGIATDATGNFAVGPLNPGNYSVGEGPMPGPGWTQTFPATGEHALTLTAGNVASGVAFGNHGPICDLIVDQTTPAQSEGPTVCCWDVRANSQLVGGLTGAQVSVSPNVSLFGAASNAGWAHVTTPGQIDWHRNPGPFAPPGLLQPGEFCAQVNPSSGPSTIEVSWLDASGAPICPRQLACGLSISGMKFDDMNGNGVRDPGEPGLAGWTITLLGPNGAIVTTTTGADGSYLFAGLLPGVYTVSEVNQPGWTQTFPAAPGTWTLDPAIDTSSRIDFGNHQSGPAGGGCVVMDDEQLGCGTASPYTYSIDFVSQAAFDLTSVTVLGITPAGVTFNVNPFTFSSPVSTFGSGSATFDVGGPGAVSGAQVCFTLSFHDALGANCCGTEVRCFTLPDCGCTNAIQGVKYYDQNGNGVRDPGEMTLPGFTIELTDAFGSVTSVVTDAFGEYAFTGLAHGTWTVTEIQQPGWQQTQPAGGAPYVFNFNQGTGAFILHADFGNKKKDTGPVDPADPKQAPAAGAPASAAIAVTRGAEKVPMLPIRTTAPADESVSVSGLTIAAAGTGDDAKDIERVRLFEDVNANGIVDAGEPELAADTFTVDDGVVTLSLPAPLVAQAGTHRDLVVAVDFARSEDTQPGATPLSPNPLVPSRSSPLTMALIAGLALMALALRRVQPRTRIAGGVGVAVALAVACSTTDAEAPPPTYRLYLVHVDAKLESSGREVRLADDAGISGPIVSVVD